MAMGLHDYCSLLVDKTQSDKFVYNKYIYIYKFVCVCLCVCVCVCLVPFLCLLNLCVDFLIFGSVCSCMYFVSGAVFLFICLSIVVLLFAGIVLFCS